MANLQKLSFELEVMIIDYLYENSLKDLRGNKRRYYFILIMLIIALIISIIFAVSIGAFKVDMKTSYEILCYKI